MKRKTKEKHSILIGGLHGCITMMTRNTRGKRRGIHGTEQD